MDLVLLKILIGFNVFAHGTSDSKGFCEQLFTQMAQNPSLIAAQDLAAVEGWGLDSFSFDLGGILDHLGAKKWSTIELEKSDRISRFDAFSSSQDLRVFALSLNSKHRLHPHENKIHILYLDQLRASMASIRSFPLDKNFRVRSLHLTGRAERLYAQVDIVDEHQNKLGETLLVYVLNQRSPKGVDILASINPKLIAWLPSENNSVKYALVRGETRSSPTVLIYRLNILKNKFEFISHVDIKSRHQDVTLFDLADPKHPNAGFARESEQMLEVIGPATQLKLLLRKNKILQQGDLTQNNFRFTQGSPFYSYFELFGSRSRGVVFNDARNKNEIILPFNPIYKKNTNIPLVYLYPLGSHTIAQVLIKEASDTNVAEWQMYFIPSEASSNLMSKNEEPPVVLLLRAEKNWAHTLSVGSSIVTIEANHQGRLILRGFTLP